MLNTAKPTGEVVTEPDHLTLDPDLSRYMYDEDQIDLHITESGGIEIVAATNNNNNRKEYNNERH